MKIETWPISKLKPWDKNPRSITPEDMMRLKAQIEKLGMYKPLLVEADGTILGGNMRYKALVEMGVKEMVVSIVDAPTDKLRLEYALSDNDSAGTYDRERLIELANLHPVDLEMFHVELGHISLKEMTTQFKPMDDDDSDDDRLDLKKTFRCPHCNEILNKNDLKEE